jgi:hypothetical protein
MSCGRTLYSRWSDTNPFNPNKNYQAYDNVGADCGMTADELILQHAGANYTSGSNASDSTSEVFFS